MAYFDEQSGLAVAIRISSIWNLKEGSAHSETIQKMGFLGRIATRHKLPVAHRFRPRAMISVDLETQEGNQLTVATTHPIVPVRPRARAKQLRTIGNVLESYRYKDKDLIIGADWNHYPGPGKADGNLRKESGLVEAAIDEPTWPIRNSKHEWLGKIVAT